MANKSRKLEYVYYNNVNVGPNEFPVGAKICNDGSEPATGVQAKMDWTSSNSYIDFSPGTLSTVTLSQDIGVGSCATAWFNITVQRDKAAYTTSRQYRIDITSTNATSVSTPTPRQLYVEYLISQNRNGIYSTGGFVVSNGVGDVPPGGTMSLVVGATYTFTVKGFTATQGYNELESFTNLPNNIFEILNVKQTYKANSDGSPVPNPNDTVYADACTWENDPTNLNYNACVGNDLLKAGGDPVDIVYTVKINPPPAGVSKLPLFTTLYDFSGSSFHYNSDYGSGARYVIFADPSQFTLSKSFVPNIIAPGGTAWLTVAIHNPTALTVNGVELSDTFPVGMTLATTPAFSHSGCGSAPPLTLAALSGNNGFDFAGGSIAPDGVCLLSMNVTVPSIGDYENVTDNLFIDCIDGGTCVDTEISAKATLRVDDPPACTTGTMAQWTTPTATGTGMINPPDKSGGLPTVSNVSTATVKALITGTNTGLPGANILTGQTGATDGVSWGTWGYKDAGQALEFNIDTNRYTNVKLSFTALSTPSGGGSGGPTSIIPEVDIGTGYTPVYSQSLALTRDGNYNSYQIDLTGITNTSGITKIKLPATGGLVNSNNNGVRFN